MIAAPVETIYACATAPGRSGVAVIRVSGPKAGDTHKALTGKAPETPRLMALFSFHDPDTHAVLDRGMSVWFQSPASFTGEDVVEYHLHGGKAVVSAFLAALAKIPACRLAEPGEFTRRAFENGKLDLTAAEAVADLIAAETEAQRAQALSQLEGGLEKIYRDWADELSRILAHQEAEIEFPDEDMPTQVAESLKPKVRKLIDEISLHLEDNRRGERLRDGVMIAILGAPNAGKSSLLNKLSGRDAAIVSAEAGTTRDIVETHLDLGGYPVILSDTAGLRATSQAVEAEGIRRAKIRAQDADIKVLLFDGTSAAVDAETLSLKNANAVLVSTKKDLPQKLDMPGAISLSTATGEGIEALLKILTDKAAQICGDGKTPILTRERHRVLLTETKTALERALQAPLPELAAEDLRLALRTLGAITGRVHVEELLDRVFRDFCIGK